MRDGRLIWSQGTFEVPPGGIVAVIGANGAGKTTLVEVILGLVRIAAGNVRVFGKRPGEENNSIGYVPQNYVSSSDEAIRVVDAVMLGLNGDSCAFRRVTASQRRRVDEPYGRFRSPNSPASASPDSPAANASGWQSPRRSPHGQAAHLGRAAGLPGPRYSARNRETAPRPA